MKNILRKILYNKYNTLEDRKYAAFPLEYVN